MFVDESFLGNNNKYLRDGPFNIWGAWAKSRKKILQSLRQRKKISQAPPQEKKSARHPQREKKKSLPDRKIINKLPHREGKYLIYTDKKYVKFNIFDPRMWPLGHKVGLWNGFVSVRLSVRLSVRGH